MRIKKTSETTPVAASVVNQKNNSTTDAYSCNYVNGMETTINGLISDVSSDVQTLIKTQTIARTVTMPGGGKDYWQMEALLIPTGYKYLGILQNKSGNETTWITSWATGGNNGDRVYAQCYNFGGSTEAREIKCTILYVKNFS